MLIPSAVLIVPGESNEVTFVQRKGVVDKNRPDFFQLRYSRLFNLHVLNFTFAVHRKRIGCNCWKLIRMEFQKSYRFPQIILFFMQTFFLLTEDLFTEQKEAGFAQVYLLSSLFITPRKERLLAALSAARESEESIK